jgi:hypothetical protein
MLVENTRSAGVGVGFGVGVGGPLAADGAASDDWAACVGCVGVGAEVVAAQPASVTAASATRTRFMPPHLIHNPTPHPTERVNPAGLTGSRPAGR